MKKSRSSLILFIVICCIIAAVLEWERYSELSSEKVHNIQSVNQDADYAEPETISLTANSFEMQIIYLAGACFIILASFVPCVLIAKHKNMFVLSRNNKEREKVKETKLNKKVEIGA